MIPIVIWVQDISSRVRSLGHEIVWCPNINGFFFPIKCRVNIYPIFLGFINYIRFLYLASPESHFLFPNRHNQQKTVVIMKLFLLSSNPGDGRDWVGLGCGFPFSASFWLATLMLYE
ncbi:hypothetical protein RJT34_01339 [Clitoria ternatea]|uniref:Uncharacterized protein n=1 Tax=Clitoria ternatea TaxID=43366 RepID=A0AAN9KJB0_CLITE